MLVAYVNDRRIVGMPGVRDPDNVCEGFDPGTPAGTECMTDGHYLCDECTERASCECGCGHRPGWCQCEDCDYRNTCPGSSW